MQQNIFTNNVEIARANLIFDRYYDFKLSRGPVYDYMGSFKPIASFDLKNGFREVPERIFSGAEWSNAICQDSILKNIGLTGTDNGFIYFNGEIINDGELYELYKKEIDFLEDYPGDEFKKKFFVSRIHDNTSLNSDKMEIAGNGNGISFKGGYYQGFFKIEDKCYQTLPSKIGNGLMVSMEIRPDSEYGGNDEQNIFFIGTRAENKFAPFYNGKFEQYDDGYFVEEYLDDDDSYNDDDYLDENEYETDASRTHIEDIETNEGISLIKNGQSSFTTDNKFITFNNTPEGFTAETWKEGDSVRYVMDGESNPNLFTELHYAEGGHTVDDIEEVRNEVKKEYDIEKDIDRNAFSIFIRKNGSIGYKYTVRECVKDEDTGEYHPVLDIVTENTEEGLLKDKEWAKIQILFEHSGIDKMTVKIFVNGLLYLISKEIQELNLRALDDNANKQEGVPYNISIGGGTDGLNNVIYPSSYKVDENGFKLGSFFSDSFYGDIRYFEITEKTI